MSLGLQHDRVLKQMARARVQPWHDAIISAHIRMFKSRTDEMAQVGQGFQSTFGMVRVVKLAPWCVVRMSGYQDEYSIDIGYPAHRRGVYLRGESVMTGRRVRAIARTAAVIEVWLLRHGGKWEKQHGLMNFDAAVETPDRYTSIAGGPITVGTGITDDNLEETAVGRIVHTSDQEGYDEDSEG